MSNGQLSTWDVMRLSRKYLRVKEIDTHTTGCSTHRIIRDLLTLACICEGCAPLLNIIIVLTNFRNKTTPVRMNIISCYDSR
eukprot:gene11469-biopygen6279